MYDSGTSVLTNALQNERNVNRIGIDLSAHFTLGILKKKIKYRKIQKKSDSNSFQEQEGKEETNERNSITYQSLKVNNNNKIKK